MVYQLLASVFSESVSILRKHLHLAHLQKKHTLFVLADFTNIELFILKAAEIFIYNRGQNSHNSIAEPQSLSMKY